MAERSDDLAQRDEEPARDAGDAEVEIAEIRAEIDVTRERLGDTVEAIGERLNPSNLKAQVKQDIRDATIGRVEQMAQSAADRAESARRTMMDTIRENPIPAAMVGVGLGWLAWNAREQRSGRGGYGSGYESRGRVNVHSPRGSGYRYGDRYASGYESARYGFEERSGGEGEFGTMDRVRERAGELTDQAREKMEEAGERAQEMASTVADRTRYGARRMEDQFYDNPLAIGVAVLAAGMAAGLALPATRREAELVGGARDRLVDRAREFADETKDKVERVAERVVDQAQSTAKQAAREEHLTSG
ncbi:MAG TPA: DUF3618 domain-containing protein [Gemmatimonadaceae bacterium]|nr:DUF3618 domain-containing protein [Gemmatimonadaceae bacterium]